MHKYIDNSESFNAEVCTSPTSRLFDLKSRSVVLLYRRKNYNNNKKVSLFKYFWTKLYLLCYQTHSLPAAASSAAEHFLLSPLCILPAETKISNKCWLQVWSPFLFSVTVLQWGTLILIMHIVSTTSEISQKLQTDQHAHVLTFSTLVSVWCY